METLSFDKKQRTKIKVNIYGQELELRKPQVGEAEMFDESVQDLSGMAKFWKMVELMEHLGLPKDVAKGMELEHFHELCGVVMGKGSEKKS